MIIFWFLLTTYIAVAFEFKCPHSSQRRFRAIGVCLDESKYSCLLDIINEVYIEMCNQTADYVVRGEKYVISGGRRSYPCSLDRYQPFKFWLHVQSKCYYKKSLCNENEQILYNISSTKDDNMCQCNYTRGYGFVTHPRNPCYCIPFQEDCTCYRIPCSANNTLTADKTCGVRNRCRVEFETVVPRMNMFSPTITQIFVADHSVGQSKSKEIMIALVIITLVLALVAVMIVLLKNDFKEDSNSKEICPKMLDEETPIEITHNFNHKDVTFDNELFKKQLRYKWSDLIKNMEPRNIIDLLGTENIDIKDDKTRYENNRLILMYFLDNTCSKMAKQFQNILENQQLLTLKWPQRDKNKCKSLLSKMDILIKEIEPNDLFDFLFEKFVLSENDYKYAILTKQPINETINATLNRGSFECVMEFFKKTKPGFYEEIKSCLPKAISAKLDTHTTPMSSFATVSGNEQTISWRDTTVKFVLQNTNGRSLVVPERMLYCSKWFIQEFALYLDPKTVYHDPKALNFLPLTEDVDYRVQKSVRSGGFLNVMEIYLCGEDVVNQLQHPSEEIEACLLVDSLGKNNSVKDTSLENPIFDYSCLLTLLEDVILNEIQPTLVKRQFCYRGIKLSTDMNPNRERNDIAKDLLIEIKTNGLSKALFEIWKNDQSYAYKRLNSFFLTDSKDSDVLKNIISNMVKIAEINIGLDELISYFVNKKVFVDNFDDLRSRPCDQAMTELMFMILQKGTMGIGLFLDALYFYNNDDLAESLLLTKAEQHFEYSSTCTAVMHETEKKDILLKAKIQVNII